VIKKFKREINPESEEYVGEEKIGSVDKETI